MVNAETANIFKGISRNTEIGPKRQKFRKKWREKKYDTRPFTLLTFTILGVYPD